VSDHSLLAPSDAERWSRCVGAPLMSKGVPDPQKEYSASGSCSHWILNYGFTHPEESIGQFLGQEMTFDGFTFTIDQARLDRVQVALDNVNREPGYGYYEILLDTTPIFGVPDQKGHADIVKVDLQGVVLIDGVEHKGVLTVHDYKDGFLLVNARNNLQGLGYLAAALYKFELLGNITALRFCIHQPKINHYDEWTYTRAEIETFVALIRPTAKLVYDLYHGNVEFDPKIHLNPGEEQCFWCPVRGRCSARARRILSMFEPLINRHELDDEMFGKLYGQLDEIAQAVKDYHAEALRRALAGRKVPGQKLVQGYQGDRAWTDKTAVERLLPLIIPEEQAYAPRKIVSPTQAEAVLKSLKRKGDYDQLKKYVYRAPGAPTLVPIGDKRDELKPTQFAITSEEGR
jgi:hypothetical protein